MKKQATPNQKDQLIAKIATSLRPNGIDFDALQELLSLPAEVFNAVLATCINQSASATTSIIDLRGKPKVPEGLTLISSTRPHGRNYFVWYPPAVGLKVLPGQKGFGLSPQRMCELLFTEGDVAWPLPAQILDFLLANLNAVPNDWMDALRVKGTRICFWGSEYYDGKEKVIRSLALRDDELVEEHIQTGGRWTSEFMTPVALA